MSDTYTVVARCTNCKAIRRIDIPKGILIKDSPSALCKNCGCAGIVEVQDAVK